MSDDFEQIITPFAKSSAMSDGPMVFVNTELYAESQG